MQKLTGKPPVTRIHLENAALRPDRRRAGRAFVQRYRVALRGLSLATLCALASCGQSSADDSVSAAGGQHANAGSSNAAGGSSGALPSSGGSAGTTTSGVSGAGMVAAGSTSVGGSSAVGGIGGVSTGGGTGGVSSGGSAGAAQMGGQSAGGNGAGGNGAGGNGASNGTDKITVWLAGDSTMANGNNPCPVGWGKQFQAHFNANASVVNSAVGGTTLRSWLYDVGTTLGSDGECALTSPNPQAHWTAMVNGMKAGDYLLIQFGINDTTGAGCPKHVSLATYKTLLGMMAQAAKDKGAQPIFVTAVSSIKCNGAMATPTRGTFSKPTKDAATQYGVPVIDLEQLSVALYTANGFCPSTDSAATFTANTPIGNFFCDDHTHFEAAGSKQIADLVAKAIKDQGFGLASYLVP